MKKISLIILCLLLMGLFCACSNNKASNSNNQENIINTTQNDKINNLIESFKEEYPDCTMIQEREYNLEDGTYVYVFIWSHPIDQENTSTTNICFVTETTISVVDLAGGDLDFRFVDNKESFRILDNPMRVSVKLNNIKTEKLYDYQVIFSKVKDDAEIKISSDEIE